MNSCRLAIIVLMTSFSILTLLFSTLPSNDQVNKQKICNILQLKTWKATIYPHNLKICGEKSSGQPVLMGAAPDSRFDDPLEVRVAKDYIEIVYSDIKVRISAKGDRVHFYFEVDKPGEIVWPASGQDTQIKAIMYPDSEGMYIPVEDEFWLKQLNGYCCENLSMPCYGYEVSNETIGYILHTDLRNELQFLVTGARLSNLVKHSCCELDQKYDYEISVAFAGKSILGPAWNYKHYLISQGVYKTLTEKACENSEVKKLFGAPHVYVWGDGRTTEFLTYMNSVGIDRLWIGFEQSLVNNNDTDVNATFINMALKLGYLVGPYDEFHTMMDPKLADCPNVIFEDMYPYASVIDSQGKRMPGFAGRGYYISSQALLLNNNQAIYNRIDKFLKTGINSYFLDCDATGELFDDYASEHTMSQYKDRENRLARMAYISDDKKMVLGSESAVAWAAPVLAFTHGTFAVNNNAHWPFMQNKNVYGGWYPSERPKIFFKSIQAQDEYVNNKYNPCYRIPLFQAVFHEALVTTDRWEISHMKFNNIVEVRELLELLYGVPSIWALDMSDIKKHTKRFKKLFSFFSPLHKIIATEPVTSFDWLTKDRKVQQITFGDIVRLVANFSDDKFKELPAKSLQAYWLQNGKKEIYIP